MSTTPSMEVERIVKELTMNELRQNCRARGLNPAGSADTLRELLKHHMMETQSTELAGRSQSAAEEPSNNFSKNNYARPGGKQNLGNHITDRPSSRVLAPPGGKDQIVLGDYAGSVLPTPARGPTYGSATPAQQAATDMLARMGLGNTDELVQGGAPAYAAAAPAAVERPLSVGMPGALSKQAGSLQLYSDQRKGISQVAFGEYQLPSYSAQHPGTSTPAANKGPAQVDEALSRLGLQQLRTECRARNINPAGGADALRVRLGEHMLVTGHADLVAKQAFTGAPASDAYDMVQGSPYPGAAASNPTDVMSNNYVRPGGQQNVGNFITGRPSSRVLAPPGGRSQITFG